MQKNTITKSFSLIFLLILMGIGCQRKSDEFSTQQQIKIDELTKKVEELSNKISEPTGITEEVESPQNKEEIKPKEDLETILINYKLDSKEGADLRTALLNAVYNSPEQLCPSIISSRTTEDNIYYLVMKDLNNLNMLYSRYESKIVYIGNNLPGLWKTIAITKDKCEASGYFIP